MEVEAAGLFRRGSVRFGLCKTKFDLISLVSGLFTVGSVYID